MKIVNISGGLGNQMFQYAFAEALKFAFPEEDVYIDIHHYNTILFRRYKGINLHNGFEINKVFPNANLPIAGMKQIAELSWFVPNYVLSRLVRKFFPVRKTEVIPPYNMNYSFSSDYYTVKSRYYEGFWQCIKHYERIKGILCKVFEHPLPNEGNRLLIDEISSCESVGIHVRRGDYLNEPEFCDICDIAYYKRAIDDVLSDGREHVFYVFSNDAEWCENNLRLLVNGSKFVIVSINKGESSCWDMFLMEYCKDLIIANSSFSWWSAFLSKKANRIYAPYPWLDRNCEIDLYDLRWIKIMK